MALHKDVREVLSWPASLIAEWIAYDQLNPLPDPWVQTGILAALMNNCWSKQKRNPEDFIPRVRSEKRRQTQEEQYQIFRAIAAAQKERLNRIGGTDNCSRV